LTSLFDEVLAEQHKRAIRSFRQRCDEWKAGETVKIVVEGAGNVFEEKYWPFLEQMIKTRGRARIFVTDVKEPTNYDDLLRRSPSVEFYNKRVLAEFEKYSLLDPDVVLVLVPDTVHMQTVTEWIGEESWVGKARAIFIEKPWDRSPLRAERFQRLFASKKPYTLCFSFDHYLSKVVDFVPRAKECIDLIGGEVSRIDFAILENGEVEPTRAAALGEGMIFDLLCHMLAITSLVTDLDTLDFVKVLPARHEGSVLPKDAETFADLEFFVQNTKGTTATGQGVVGKGVGQEPHKFILLEGKQGWIQIDLNPIQIDLSGTKTIERKIEVFQNGAKKREYAVRDGYKNFLGVLFGGDYVTIPAGALTHEASMSIVKNLEDAKGRVRSLCQKKDLPEYKVGTSLDELRRLCREYWSQLS